MTPLVNLIDIRPEFSGIIFTENLL